MTRERAIIMLQILKHYIAETPIDRCTYCSGCSHTIIPDEDCKRCIDAGLRALDLAIEKIKEDKR